MPRKRSGSPPSPGGRSLGLLEVATGGEDIRVIRPGHESAAGLSPGCMVAGGEVIDPGRDKCYLRLLPRIAMSGRFHLINKAVHEGLEGVPFRGHGREVLVEAVTFCRHGGEVIGHGSRGLRGG